MSADMPIVVGFSGGADSTALLDALHGLGYKLVAAHFDHGFRASSSDDVAFTRAAAERMGVQFVTGAADVPAQARELGLSLEEAGRAARYAFLFDQARACKAQAVAVGHTADDQVETVLMHLLRGSGLAGLKGMQARAVLPEWDTAIPVVRPLLSVWRAETEAWCVERGLVTLEDASNRDTTFFRNRLRHELIPYLQGYNPRIKEGLLRTARSLAGDHAVLEGVTEAAWQACLLHEQPGQVALRRETLLGLETGLQRGVLRRAIHRLRPRLRDLDFETVERALAFARAPGPSGQVDLALGLRLYIQDGELRLEEWNAALRQAYPQMAAEDVLLLHVPGSVDLADGWQMHADWVGIEAGSAWPDDPAQVWLDADTLSLPLAVRTRRPGDRFAPLGMDGRSMKLSDFFVNTRLEQRARAGWPIVFSGNQLAWVPLYRPAHAFRVRAETRRVAYLRIQRAD